MLSPDQRPVLNQVTKLKRERSTSAHLRGERHDQATETGQPQPKCNLSLKWPLVTAFLSTPELAARAARQGSNEDGLGGRVGTVAQPRGLTPPAGSASMTQERSGRLQEARDNHCWL